MSTVRISWLDSVTPGVLGTKVYRDDIEIADVLNGVQTYDDTTAAEATTYKYEVQAYTIDGESTDEVIGVNVENITTTSPINDIYAQDNAASKTEVNAKGSWIEKFGQGSIIITSVGSEDTVPLEGSYSLKFVAQTGNAVRGEYEITGQNGSTVNITMWIKEGTNIRLNEIRFEGFTDISPYNITATSVWTEYNFTRTINADPAIIRMNYGSGGEVGDTLYLDKMTIALQ